MTKTPEVVAVMEATTTLTKPNGFIVSRLNAALLFTAFMVCVVAAALVAYHLSSCNAGWPPGGNTDELINGSYNPPQSSRLYVRLPTSVVPHSYKIELVPFVFEGNFTFNGKVMIVVNITQNTDNITLHINDIDVLHTDVTKLVDVNGDEIYDSIDVESTEIDLERQFYVIKTTETLQAGTQYRVFIKYIGNLNDVLQGFYRSSYNVNSTKRYIFCIFVLFISQYLEDKSLYERNGGEAILNHC